MNKFDTIAEKYQKLIINEAVPPAPDPNAGNEPTEAGNVSALPGVGGNTPPAAPPMDKETEKEVDPVEFTENLLNDIADLPPNDFNKYIDQYSNTLQQNKDMLKREYNQFYVKINQFLKLKEELKPIFNALQQNTDAFNTSKSEFPRPSKPSQAP